MIPFGDTFTDLRVLDLSTNFAGPLACQILGDLGADVIKIERPVTGEDTRSLPPFAGSQSTVFRAVNRNKRSVALDLSDEAGREAVLRLSRRADVVVSSFRPATAARLRLRYEDFREASASLVVCSISAFGAGALGRERAGYDALVQAFTGMMSLTGDEDGPPARSPAAIIDYTTGLWATAGILAALHRRERSGAGEHIEVALVDSAFQLLSHQVLGVIATGDAPGRTGSAGPSAAPYEAFRAADGCMMIACANDALFERLCRAMDRAELATDPRFASMAERVGNREALHELLQEQVEKESMQEWLERFATAGVPAAPVNDLDVALADGLTEERSLFVHADGDDRPLIRSPIDLEARGRRRRPPDVGEHTREVLGEAGFTAREIASLTADLESMEPTGV